MIFVILTTCVVQSIGASWEGSTDMASVRFSMQKMKSSSLATGRTTSASIRESSTPLKSCRQFQCRSMRDANARLLIEISLNNLSQNFTFTFNSNIKEDWWLVREHLLLNAEDGSPHLVVNIGQVTGGGTLSNSTELIIHGTVAKANPSLVSTQVWHGNATQVSANSRAAKHRRVTSRWNWSLGSSIEKSGVGERVGEVDFRFGQTTNENHLTVPGGLGDLSWGEFRDIELLVCVTDVTITGDHLVVNDSEDGLDANDVVTEDETLEHINLGAANFVVAVLFVPGSL